MKTRIVAIIEAGRPVIIESVEHLLETKDVHSSTVVDGKIIFKLPN